MSGLPLAQVGTRHSSAVRQTRGASAQIHVNAVDTHDGRCSVDRDDRSKVREAQPSHAKATGLQGLCSTVLHTEREVWPDFLMDG